MYYKIVRMYRYATYVRRRTIDTGLSLEQAQEHCNDPATSSRTAPAAIANRVRRSTGCSDWFDGYEET